MDPIDSTDSPAAAHRAVAIAAARRLVQNALSDAIALRGRLMMLADATDWRARGAEHYRAGIASLRSDLDRLVQLIAASDDDLAVQQRHASSIAPLTPFAPVGW